MSDPITITSTLPAARRGALEELLFFNVNQHRVRLGIQQSIERYGVPEIIEHDGCLRIRVGDIEGAQTLFAVGALGEPLGAAVFVRQAHERFVVLHVGVASTQVLKRLMQEIRATARRTRGVDRIEVVYQERPSMRSQP